MKVGIKLSLGRILMLASEGGGLSGEVTGQLLMPVLCEYIGKLTWMWTGSFGIRFLLKVNRE